MKDIKLASPLYIVRDDCAADLRAALGKLAGLGFDGIEFLGLFGHTAKEVRSWLDELGLAGFSDHVPLAAMESDGGKSLDEHAELGCRYVVASDVPQPGSAEFASVPERVAKVAEAARGRGITLLYHNHAKELKPFGTARALDAIMDSTPLALEPDLGWMEIGGGDAASYLEKYRERCPVIHLKDYYADDLAKLGEVSEFLPARGGAERGCFEFRPTGFGVLNLPKLMPKCLACGPEWFVLDHDLAYDRSSYDDLGLSLAYVKSLLALERGAGRY